MHHARNGRLRLAVERVRICSDIQTEAALWVCCVTGQVIITPGTQVVTGYAVQTVQTTAPVYDLPDQKVDRS